MKRCRNCLKKMDARGRPSETGAYYCAEPDCRRRRDAERARIRRARANSSSGSTCVSCGCAVSPQMRPSFDGNHYCYEQACRNNYQRAYQLHQRKLDEQALVIFR